MLYEYTGITSMLGLFTFLNTITNNVFWTLMVFAAFIIIIVVLSRYEIEDNVLVASFVCSTFSILLKVGGLVSDVLVIIFILMTALIAMGKFFFANR